jgi:lauroyl/myristoyl acyltransferase
MNEGASLSRFKRLRYRVEWLLCAGFAAVVPRLPRSLCAQLAEGLGGLACRLDRRGHAVALDNLRCIFGDRFTETEREAIVLRSYQTFTRTMIDLFWAPSLTAENWREYIEFEGDPAPRDGRGVIMMCVHWGNFEWASLSVGFLGCPTSIVAENFKNQLLSDIFNGNREVSGHTIIPQENSMIRLLKVVKRQGAAGMLVDLTLRPEQAAIPIEAFGLKMSATPLHAVLAERGGALLIPVHAEPLPDGRCRVVVDPPLEVPPDANAQQIAQACWDHFEKRIRERPELWMWAYKHWRYRPKTAAPEDYPFYANVSSKFDKLLTGKPVSTRKQPSRPSQAMENGAVN